MNDGDFENDGFKIIVGLILSALLMYPILHFLVMFGEYFKVPCFILIFIILHFYIGSWLKSVTRIKEEHQ